MKDSNIETLYLFCGSIYTPGGVAISHPTILIDPEDDVFHGWGEDRTINPKCANINAAGFRLVTVDLSNLPVETAAYIIIRMTRYTQSGFVKNFYEHQTDPNALDWLAAEMRRIPINIPTRD